MAHHDRRWSRAGAQLAGGRRVLLPAAVRRASHLAHPCGCRMSHQLQNIPHLTILKVVVGKIFPLLKKILVNSHQYVNVINLSKRNINKHWSQLIKQYNNIVTRALLIYLAKLQYFLTQWTE